MVVLNQAGWTEIYVHFHETNASSISYENAHAQWETFSELSNLFWKVFHKSTRNLESHDRE